MVEYESTSQDLDGVFHALADPTRRAMVQQLSVGARTVTELAKPFAMSLAAASKHIKVLERAGLVQRTVEGRTHTCRLDAQPMRATLDWIRRYEAFWDERLDILESRLLAEDQIAAKSKITHPTKPKSHKKKDKKKTRRKK